MTAQDALLCAFIALAFSPTGALGIALMMSGQEGVGSLLIAFAVIRWLKRLHDEDAKPKTRPRIKETIREKIKYVEKKIYLSGKLTQQDAYSVLGIKEAGATQDQIRSAYRQMMVRVHPDHPGGSPYLAAKVNEAKQLLLGK